MNYYFPETKSDVILKKGMLLYVPKEYPYIATYIKNGTVANVLTFDMFREKLPEHFNNPILKKSDVFIDMSEVITSGNTFFLLSKIYELLSLTENEDGKIPDKYTRILPAINNIRQNYYENKNVSHYAEMCCMSESNFRKLFKEYTGRSFIDFRNHIRALKAKAMIESGEFNVSEAAKLTGFNNMSFFMKCITNISKKNKNCGF